jgi:hypothetical protein
MPCSWLDRMALKRLDFLGCHGNASPPAVFVFLVLPLAFLLWFASLTRPTWPNSSLLDLISIPDAFDLDSAFDYLAPPRSRVDRWTVSAVAVPNTNRTHLVVNGRSPGSIIEANASLCVPVHSPNILSSFSGLLDQRPKRMFVALSTAKIYY